MRSVPLSPSRTGNILRYGNSIGSLVYGGWRGFLGFSKVYTTSKEVGDVSSIPYVLSVPHHQSIQLLFQPPLVAKVSSSVA